jgi:trans-2,3-dihydro-3-hydroxyanthranilate isomerase
MRYRFYTADVFTDRIFGGNQLAVLPDAAGLSPEQMQRVAAEFNYSETAFVFPPEDARNTRRVRIFTPATELPFAGHPTLGAAHVLAAAGEVELSGDTTPLVLEEGVGPVSVEVRAENGRPVFCRLRAAQPPEFGPEPPPVPELAAMLSLEEPDLLPDAQAVSCGMPFLFVPLRDLDAVRRARLNRERWEAALAGHWAPSVFVFAREAERAGSDLHARMFAPAVGVEEDPATGSAAAALAGYLGVRDETRDGTLRWVVEQGFELGRPSILEAEAVKRAGELVEIRVGGASVMVSEGTMEIPGP